jgi:hypothetical protein
MSEIIATPEQTYSGELVTVAKFMDPVEAQMARGALEAAGINVFVAGENANNILPMNVIFRARLQVAVEDEAAAREILGSAGDALLPGESEGDLT